MSEYQYYEFQAIDRPLTREEMAELRALSTRASITATRFQNEYHWGDFKGDPLVMMERYFDAHLYFANWGTRVLMFRLPVGLLDTDTALRYCFSECAEVYTRGEHTILEFHSENEAGEDWDEGPEGWLGTIVPLRADLMEGDLRALYISWLSCARTGLLDDEDLEPPVPAGLGKLSAALQGLADFLRVDGNLRAVAAERSAPRRTTTTGSGELARWLATLSASEKDAALLRLLSGDAPHLRAELLRQFHAAQAAQPAAATTTDGDRTVGELLAAAEAHREGRRRAQAQCEAEAQERQARADAAARARYLDDLVSRQEEAWRQIDALLEERRGKAYDEATQLLVDLREVSERVGTLRAYRERVRQIRLSHPKQPAFLARLDRADLAR